MILMNIDIIKTKVKRNEYDLTIHALKRRIERNISTSLIENAILKGEIIEEYPDDFPYPSCLINGFINNKEPIHIVCAIAERLKIITIYRPEDNDWKDYKVRRRKN